MAARNRVLQLRQPLMWVGIQPVPELSLELSKSKWEPLFQDPTLSGNRPAGWTFANRYVQSQLAQGRLTHGEPDYREVQLFRTGLIQFTVPLDRLEWMNQAGAFWPYALIEYPVSVFRLAAAIYKSITPAPTSAYADVALVRAGEWRLKPFSPDAFGGLVMV